MTAINVKSIQIELSPSPWIILVGWLSKAHVPMNIPHKSSRSDKMKDLLQKLKAQIGPKTPPSPSRGFRVLPPEIMVMIIRFLCAPDLICFAFSCKYALACVQPVLGAHKPRLCQDPRCYLFEWPTYIRALMSRLERDSNLRYCDWCYKLHPFSLRRALRATLGLRVKPCCPLRETGSWTLPDP